MKYRFSRLRFVLLTIFAFLVAPYCWNSALALDDNSNSDETQAIVERLDGIKARFAPDKRLELFDVKIDDNSDAPSLSVDTTSNCARDAVLELKDQFPNWQIVARLLPQENEELEGKWRAIVKYSTIQIQTGPDFATEWSTQSLMGTPVRILKKAARGWLLVQNADGYIGYATSGSVKPMTQDEYDAWLDSTRVVWLDNSGVVYSEPNYDAVTVSDLVAGNVLQLLDHNPNGSFIRVATPAGIEGWIPAKRALEWRKWLQSRSLTADNLISSARRLLGRPYVWGGTSAKGVDCSGLVNFAFYTNGYNILRDVSQIQREGTPVDMSQGWRGFAPGDLLLFGSKRDDGSVAWRHVAIYIGEGRFIHSATSVHESSLDPNDPDFDPGNARELQKVVRMIGAPETDYFHPIEKNRFFQKSDDIH